MAFHMHVSHVGEGAAVYVGGHARPKAGEADDIKVDNKPAPHPYCIDTDIENLIFKGGGMKGYAYSGALALLGDAGKLKKVKRYGGASAGAITAALLAIGYTTAEMEKIFKTQDFKIFMDSNGLLDKAQGLFKDYGVYNGKVFTDWMGSKIKEKLGNPDITFAELKEKTGKELVVVGTCITHMECHYFSATNSPKMTIRQAVRISMSIPLFFDPVIIDDHFFVDGGMCDNFPLSIFDADDKSDTAVVEFRDAPVNKHTLGLFLLEDIMLKESVRKVTGLFDVIFFLLDTIMNRTAQLGIKSGDELRTIFIHTRHVPSTNFDISDAEKDLLFHEGQSAARKFLGLKYNVHPIVGPTEKFCGRLVVHLLMGENLRDTYFSGDPYVVFTFEKNKLTSNYKYKTASPVWNENFVFQVTDPKQDLTVEVFDYEWMQAARSMAKQTIPISSLTKLLNNVDVKVGQGRLQLQLTWSPN